MANPPANLPFEPAYDASSAGRPVPPTGGMAPAGRSSDAGGPPPRPTPPPPPTPPAPTPPPPAPKPVLASRKEPEDIFSNIEAAQAGEKLEAGSSKLGAGSGQGPLPSGVGGALKTFFIILVIIVAVVAIGGGLFWFFVLRTPAETGTPNEIPTVKTNGSPIPTAPTPTPTPVPTPTQPVIPTPVTEPPDGVNIPPPTSVTDTPPVEPEPEVDTDGDGLSDGEEVTTYGTNPSLQDTDGDGFSDAEEIRNGYNPLGAGQCANPDCRP